MITSYKEIETVKEFTISQKDLDILQRWGEGEGGESGRGEWKMEFHPSEC